MAAFLDRVGVEFSQVRAETNWANGISWVESVQAIAGREGKWQEVASSQTVVSSSDTNVGINSIGKRGSKVETLGGSINHASLDDSS